MWPRGRSRKHPEGTSTSLITSLDNPRVRRARRLARRSIRHEERAFLVEGRSFIAEAMGSGLDIVDLFLSEDAAASGDLPARAEGRGIQPAIVPESVMRSMADAVTPQGAIAVVRMPPTGPDQIPSVDLVLVLASIRDPGNAGTLVRSAVAAGAGAVLFVGESVDPFSPKTVRASAGNLFKVPVIMDATLQWVDRLKGAGVALIGASAEAEVTMFDTDLTGPSALVIGNEAWGFPEDVAAALDRTVAIPMPGPSESLNAGIAGSILLFESVRQRRLGSTDHG